jgi:hypothetical protein
MADKAGDFVQLANLALLGLLRGILGFLFLDFFDGVDYGIGHWFLATRRGLAFFGYLRRVANFFALDKMCVNSFSPNP